MVSQADYEKVKHCLLEPIKQAYSCELNAYFVDSLTQDVYHYSPQILEAAMVNLRKTCKNAPKIAHVIDSCEWAAKQHPITMIAPVAIKFPWEERYQVRQRMVTEYLERYQKSELYLIASSERWEWRLYRYVRAIAEIQAQILNPSPTSDIGYSYFATVPERKIHEVILEQRKIVASGHIDVIVPNEVINHFKALTLLEAQKYQQEQEIMARQYGVSIGSAMQEVGVMA